MFLPPANEVCEGYVFTLSFCPQGACVVVGGVHGRGACVRGVHGGGGHVWWVACMARGACMAGGHTWQGGMHGRGACMAGGHAWQGGMHGRGSCAPQQILRDTVNEREVSILLECILVYICRLGCLTNRSSQGY